MSSDKFRRQLREEIDKWHSEGLIDSSLSEKLSHRYQFNELEGLTRNRFIRILLLLGKILLCLGIITFISANWQIWSRELKVGFLLTIFLTLNAGGFFLWRYPKQRLIHWLGEGLLFLGGLSLGVNMLLMSQLFTQNRPVYQFYLVWGLGVLAMAYTLRMKLLGFLSIFLISIGYILGQGQPYFLALGEFYILRLIWQHFSVCAGLMFIPLAYRCNSRWIFRLGFLAIIYALTVNLIRVNFLIYPPLLAGMALALPPAMLWGYRDELWGKNSAKANLFDRTSRTMAILVLSLILFMLSFQGIWYLSLGAVVNDIASVHWYLLIDLIILGSLTIWGWLRLLQRWDFRSSMVGGAIAICGIVPYIHLSTGNFAIAAIVIFNLLLFILAVSLIREGLTQAQRRLFWGGILLLTLQILSRLIEYTNDPMSISVVLFLFGLIGIAATLWFERQILHK
ncbi:MAG TPA: DUF2157 domain-containing protein [Cyanobacteria bacterium UBA11153]|nr:DUF2157 domain-containing protein [Cyanobacteria bacterium UBA11153]